MKNLILIFAITLTTVFTSCKNKSEDPTPSNSGGNGGKSSTYFTSLDQTFTCDDLYEHVTFDGHSFSVYGYDGLGCEQSADCIKWGQIFSEKDGIPYNIGGIGSGNGAAPLSADIINNAIKSKGSFKVGQFQDFATTDYGVYNSTTIQYSYSINIYGYDPETNNSSKHIVCVGIDTPGDFYAEITKVQRVYPKELSDMASYVIEGKKKILIRSYDGISTTPIDDTLITTFKSLVNLAE